MAGQGLEWIDGDRARFMTSISGWHDGYVWHLHQSVFVVHSFSFSIKCVFALKVGLLPLSLLPHHNYNNRFEINTKVKQYSKIELHFEMKRKRAYESEWWRPSSCDLTVWDGSIRCFQNSLRAADVIAYKRIKLLNNYCRRVGGWWIFFYFGLFSISVECRYLLWSEKGLRVKEAIRTKVAIKRPLKAVNLG